MGKPMADRQVFDLAVLGGGPAGVTAALRAAELGASTILLEAERLGGVCTDDGCAPTRVLAHASRLIRDAAQFDAYGLSGGVPRLDFARLIAQTQATVYRLHEKKQLAGHLAAAGVTVAEQAGAVRFSGPHTLVLGDGRRVSAERLVICVGGHARRLPFPGSELAITHSDVWQLRALPSRIAIVGSAATGSQLASIFAGFGSRVTLLDLAPRILPGEDMLVSAAMESAFAERGIEILTGIRGVERLTHEAGRLQLGCQLAQGDRALAVDAVILAVGWVGNVESLGLEAAGVATNRGYVTVDDHLRTTAQHIYAAGDVTGRMMLVQSAADEARLAAENAVRGAARRTAHRIVPHGGFTDPEYGSVGLTDTQAAEQEPIAVGTVPYADLDRAVIDRRTTGVAKLVVSRRTRQMLGAHVVGEQAVEVVQIAAAGMAAGMQVDQLAELELAYPTFTAILGLAARRVVRQLDERIDAERWQTLAKPGAEWEWRDQAPPRPRDD